MTLGENTPYLIEPSTHFFQRLYSLALRIQLASQVSQTRESNDVRGPVILVAGRKASEITSFLINQLPQWGVSPTLCVLDPYGEYDHPMMTTPPG